MLVLIPIAIVLWIFVFIEWGFWFDRQNLILALLCLYGLMSPLVVLPPFLQLFLYNKIEELEKKNKEIKEWNKLAKEQLELLRENNEIIREKNNIINKKD